MSRTLLAPLSCLPLLACAHAQAPEVTSWVVAVEAAAQRSDALTAEDIVALRGVGDVELSPDGKWVAHTLRVPSPLDEPGRSHNQIWLIDAAGKHEPRRLTAEGKSSYSPRWSPDGAQLAFLRGGQVHLVSVAGGEPELAFESSSSVSSFEWSPDGSQIAYSTRRETEAVEAEHEAGRDWIVDEVGGTKARLFIHDLASAADHEVSTSGEHVIDFEWAPDGSRLAVRASSRPAIDYTMMYSSIYTVDAAGGALTKLTETAGKLGHMAWSPKGDQLAFLGAADIHDSMAGIVYVVPSSGGEAKALTPELEATGSTIEWSDDDTLVMLAQQSTKSIIAKLPAAGGPIKTLIDSGPVCTDVSFGPRNTVACAGSTAVHPREVFTGKLGGKLARVTVSNPSLLTRKLGEQEVVSWKAADGLELEGVIVKPVGYQAGTRYPLAILPHGGPEGNSQNGWTTRATYPAQLFATHGYVVFMPNYRGSAGRGTKFETADHKDLGGEEFNDVLAGIDHLAAEGLIDPERVGMGGWSYGGYFSALAATTHSERFKAAMVAAAITNWVSFTGTTEIEHENSLVHWNLWPWDDMALAWERSPLADIGKSKTATLIVHGLADTRVPTGQSYELFRGLKHLGVTTQLVMYPREGHGISENVHGLDFAKRFVGWFDTHVKGEGG